MTVQVMSVPNPNRSGFARVIVIGEDADQHRLTVLDIGALGKNPRLMNLYGHSWATAYGNYIALVVAMVGIALSFFWRSWAFIPTSFVAIVMMRMTDQNKAELAAKIVAENKAAYDHFVRLGLIWEAPAETVAPEFKMKSFRNWPR
jgi:hypothetical protein